VHVEIVDKRPVAFLDRITYRDALQNDSVISIGAQLLVDDACLSGGHFVETSRERFASHRVGDARDGGAPANRRPSADSRVRMAADIIAAVNADLKLVGMKVQNLEIAEVATRAAATQPQVTTNLN
jgi:hypothetical protein